jgi:hypothetical protein
MSVARFTIDKTVEYMGLLLQKRRVRPSVYTEDGRICVNLGCGLAVAPGWLNVDASLNVLFAGAPELFLTVLYRFSGANRYYSQHEYCKLLSEHSFLFHDLARSLPFRENTVDVFYSSHFFEHLFVKDAKRLLRDIHFSLKERGLVRIAVPDLAYAVKIYHAGKTKEMLENYFFVEDKSSYLARHKYMYDYPILHEMLADAGFNNIHQCGYQEGDVPDLSILDNRPEETLYVEATR